MNEPELFSDKGRSEDFIQWMAAHPQGFYLNELAIGAFSRGSGSALLHRVGCFHLEVDASMSTTTHAKAAGMDAAALEVWAKQQGLKGSTMPTLLQRLPE